MTWEAFELLPRQLGFPDPTGPLAQIAGPRAPTTDQAANRDRIPSGWSLCLSDFSIGMVAEAKRALGPVPQVFAYQVVDAQHIPVRDGTFDCVITNRMLYHVPIGRLIASTVGDAHMQEIDAPLRAAGVPPESLGRASSAAFTLENGAAQLRAVFGNVTLQGYADALEVTEVEPLIAYIHSMRCGPRLSPVGLKRIAENFSAKIQHRGATHVTKDTGLVVARGRSAV